MSDATLNDASTLAHRIVNMPEVELSEFIHRLRRERRLSRTVHALNGLTRSAPSAELARQALRHLGLARCG